MTHEDYMSIAVDLARISASEGEVPVGCVVVAPNGDIIGTGRNRREMNHDATAHAEIEAIRHACAFLGTWRLDECSLYVTLEPCPMCAGAIINSRIPRVFYGSKEEHSGSCGSVINLFMERYEHEPQIVGGILSGRCSAVLQDFFRDLRK